MPRLLMAASLVYLFGFILLKAWVSDDAYVTFRVVDNAVHGYGLRWNTFERVQAYTHPLWMLLHIPLYAVWGDIFRTTLALSIACIGGAVFFASRAVDAAPEKTAILLFLPLAASMRFTDFATSGLESPLSCLLYAATFYVLTQKRAHPYFWFWLACSIALALFTRLDTAVLYAPLCLYLLIAEHKRIRWRQVCTGSLPLLCWLAFSLFYYGFIFPNTKYAKLGTGLDFATCLQQGIIYLIDGLSNDIIMLLIFGLMVIQLPTSLAALRQQGATSTMLAFGVIAYLVYVVPHRRRFHVGTFSCPALFCGRMPDRPAPEKYPAAEKTGAVRCQLHRPETTRYPAVERAGWRVLCATRPCGPDRLPA